MLLIMFRLMMCITTNTNETKKHYMFCGEILEEIDNHPYLEVLFDTKMKWFSHISNISRKVNVVLNLIKRNVWDCPREAKEVA